MLNIDVVSAGRDTDIAILGVARLLQDEIVAMSVPDMVAQVQRRVRPGELRRLRIWGHGAPGLACVGEVPAAMSLESAQEVLERNSLRTIRVVRTEIHSANGQEVRYPLLNEERLGALRDRFSSGSWAEIHACRVAEGELGRALLKGLARVWHVNVSGGRGLQVPGGGFENTAIVAHPGGSLREIPAPPSRRVGGCSAPW